MYVGYPNRIEAVNPRKMNLTIKCKSLADLASPWGNHDYRKGHRE